MVKFQEGIKGAVRKGTQKNKREEKKVEVGEKGKKLLRKDLREGEFKGRRKKQKQASVSGLVI